MTRNQQDTLLAMRSRAESLELLASWYPNISHLPARATEAREMYEAARARYEEGAAS